MASIGQMCCLMASLFPKVFCTLLYIWSYFTVVIQVLLQFQFFSNCATTLLLIYISIFAVLGVVSYYLVVVVGPGSPLDFSALCRFDYQQGDSITPPPHLLAKSVMVKGDGSYRFCNKCKCWKPDRCHHCSSCNKCILKMDHHCPWFAECIGFRNHKFFVQFLCYTSIYATSVALVCGKALRDIFFADKDSEDEMLEFFSLNFLFVFIVGVIMGFAVTIFALFTIYQLLKNRTTIETYEYNRFRHSSSTKNPGNLFDLGYKNNWKSVMGYRPIDWLLPTRLTSLRFGDNNDGTSFAINEFLYRQMKSHNDLQQRLSSELSSYRSQQKAIQQEGIEELMKRGVSVFDEQNAAESQRLL